MKKTDKSYSVGSSSDSEEGLLPASKWQYLNLKDTNIFYNDKPEPLKKFMQNVKTDITMEFPNFEKKMLKSFAVLPQRICSLLSTLILMPSARTLIRSPSSFLVINNVRSWSLMADVKTNIERAGRVDKDLDHTSL